MLLLDIMNEKLKYDLIRPNVLDASNLNYKMDKVLFIFNSEKMKILEVDYVIMRNTLVVKIKKGEENETIIVNSYQKNIYFDKNLIILSRRFFDIPPSGTNIFIDDENEMKLLMGMSNII